MVGVGDLHLLAPGAKLDSLSVGQIGLECFVNGCIELIWAEFGTVGSDLFKHLPRVSIKLLEVSKGNYFAEKLLPPDAWEVPVHR